MRLAYLVPVVALVLATAASAQGRIWRCGNTYTNDEAEGRNWLDRLESAENCHTVAVTLKELQNGDAACYVVVVDGTEEKSLPGDFELCQGGKHDATALIGKKVTFTTEKQNVLAASCEGNVDCGKSDQVDLVMTITAVP